MHNIKEIRKDFSKFQKSLEKRNLEVDFEKIQKLDEQNRNLIQKKESLEKEKKDISKSKDKSLFEKSKEISNKKFYGIANYGVKPTFMKKTPILEVHIFKFDEEIYGKKIKVSFLKFIRKEKRFESVEKLKDQIIKDIKLVKKNGIFKNN